MRRPLLRRTKSAFQFTCQSLRWRSECRGLQHDQGLLSECRVNSFFQLILAIDATIFRNTIQIIGLSIFNGLFLVYAVIQVSSRSLFSFA